MGCFFIARFAALGIGVGSGTVRAAVDLSVETRMALGCSVVAQSPKNDRY
jgi:hypothetical protein